MAPTLLAIPGDDNTIVVAAAHADPGAGDITVIASTGATTIGQGLWTYGQASEITGVSPNFGQRGNRVEITGTILQGGGTAVDAVLLAGVEATVIDQSDTALNVIAATATSPVHGKVVLVADTGATVSLENGWTYEQEGEATSLNPSSGQVGTSVTIHGTSLKGHGRYIEQVTLGGVTASIVTLEPDETECRFCSLSCGSYATESPGICTSCAAPRASLSDILVGTCSSVCPDGSFRSDRCIRDNLC